MDAHAPRRSAERSCRAPSLASDLLVHAGVADTRRTSSSASVAARASWLAERSREMDILKIIQERQSARVPFDRERPVPAEHLRQILEAARWTPTAHNMQNFEIVVVDDRRLLDAIAGVRAGISEEFIRENYEQLSFSEEELRRKKVGLLATMFPASWRTPGKEPHLDEAHAHSILGEPIRSSAALLVVLYDPRRRAPASEGDVLGMMSLGCLMQNMWLVASALGIGFQVQSSLAAPHVENEVKKLLAVPPPLRIGFACRLGYPLEEPRYLRVRRDVADFVKRNRYESGGR
jgi:nitroreductase